MAHGLSVKFEKAEFAILGLGGVIMFLMPPMGGIKPIMPPMGGIKLMMPP